MHEMIYWVSKTTKEHVPFHVSMAGMTDDPNYRMERRSSGIFVGAYIQRGKGHLIYEGKEYALSEGDSFFLHINSRHTYFADPEDPFQFLWFNASGVLASYLLDIYELRNRVTFCDPEIESLFLEFHEICKAGRSEDEVDSKCAIQFHRIVAAFSQNMRDHAQTGSLAQRVKAVIDSNLKYSITIREIASQMGYSEAYINRMFKIEFGETPYHYMLRNKLLAAQKLLAETNLRIKQVAELFSFNDEFHFSNAFYKQFGYRPKKVRRGALAQPEDGEETAQEDGFSGSEEKGA